MTTKQFVNITGGVAVFAALALAGMFFSAAPGQAHEGGSDDEAMIRQGFEIAPVPLNMAGKNPSLVGLGSYLVNAIGDCNGCHSDGPPTQYTATGNPYQLSPPFSGTKQVNPATYLGGGRNFGALIPGSANIISRNLTPDKTGMAAGGRTFAEFLQIIRTGVDLDHLHPQCPTGTVGTSCVPAPFNGNLLQVMSWPTLQNMSYHHIRAIYEYLSAIPCIAGPSDPNDPLHNNCP
jgi:hypothetical protein